MICQLSLVGGNVRFEWIQTGRKHNFISATIHCDARRSSPIKPDPIESCRLSTSTREEAWQGRMSHLVENIDSMEAVGIFKACVSSSIVFTTKDTASKIRWGGSEEYLFNLHPSHFVAASQSSLLPCRVGPMVLCSMSSSFWCNPDGTTDTNTSTQSNFQANLNILSTSTTCRSLIFTFLHDETFDFIFSCGLRVALVGHCTGLPLHACQPDQFVQHSPNLFAK
jgi:hypothetical protein